MRKYIRLSLFNVVPYILVIAIFAGADPGFFPRGGPGHSATETPQASQWKVRRGVWEASPKKILNMKCSRRDSEQTSGTFEIFSRAIFLGTLLQFCENSVFND